MVSCCVPAGHDETPAMHMSAADAPDTNVIEPVGHFWQDVALLAACNVPKVPRWHCVHIPLPVPSAKVPATQGLQEADAVEE